MERLRNLSVSHIISESVRHPEQDVEVARILFHPYAKGTVFAFPGHNVRDAYDWRHVREDVVNNLEFNYVGVIRNRKTDPDTIDCMLQQAEKAEVKQPKIFIAHSAGTVPVWRWLHADKKNINRVDAVVCINPVIFPSRLTQLITTTELAYVYPQIEALIQSLNGSSEGRIDPMIHTETLQDIAKPHNPTFHDELIGKVRILLPANPRDPLIHVQRIRETIPSAMIRNWQEYGIPNHADPFIQHDPSRYVVPIIHSLLSDIQ